MRILLTFILATFLITTAKASDEIVRPMSLYEIHHDDGIKYSPARTMLRCYTAIYGVSQHDDNLKKYKIMYLRAHVNYLILKYNRRDKEFVDHSIEMAYENSQVFVDIYKAHTDLWYEDVRFCLTDGAKIYLARLKL